MAILTEIDRSILRSHVRASLGELLVNREDVKGFIGFLSGFGKVVVFGGFVRDAIHNYLHNDKQKYRDLDLVVLGHFHTHRGGPQNNFGGYRKLFADGLRIDYWTLDSTYAFNKGLFKPSLSNLPCTTVFTINACVFEPKESVLYECGAIDAIAERRICFNCKDYLNVFPEYQAFRAIDFSQRLRYLLDEPVLEFVRNTLAEIPFSAFSKAVRRHRPEMLVAELEKIYQRYTSPKLFEPTFRASQGFE